MNLPTYHLIDAKHRDEILNTRRTVCGLQGNEGRSADEIVVDGVVHRLTPRPAGVTCDRCLPGVRFDRFSRMQRSMLRDAATSDGVPGYQQGLSTRRHRTYMALHRRGLVEGGKITPRGRKVLAKDKSL